MSGSPEGVHERGIVDPGIPVDISLSTKSFWLSEPVAFSRLQSPWIDVADVVIVGSGITGASLARTLYQKIPTLKVVVVDARDICSGATGRNGGHIKTMTYAVWFDRKARYGVEEAVRLTAFEHSHLAEMVACIQERQIDCDLRFLEGVDAYYDDVSFRKALVALEDLRKYAPRIADKYSIYSTRNELRKLACSDVCVGAIGVPAASLWPYKMVTGLIGEMVKKNGLSVQTNTKVLSITDNDEDQFATVKTDRGEIRTTHVIHATNGWMGHLIPELRPYISPVRGNVQRQVAEPPTLDLQNSFWLRYAEKDYDYMIPRPDGDVVIGRANLGRRATGDDSTTDLLPHAHLRGVLPYVLDLPVQALKVTHSWSGILGFTQDGSPFVGQLPFPNRSHQWVCGGYHGIGMVKAFKSAQIVALLVLGEDLPPSHPRSMFITEDRLDALRKSLLPQESSA